jgi:Protein of unknown function (DUF3365)
MWPVNKQNKPKTKLEKEGLQFVVDNVGKNYYGEEKLGDTLYYTAVYADIAVAPACVECHNAHKDSPRHDFKIGEVMGGWSFVFRYARHDRLIRGAVHSSLAIVLVGLGLTPEESQAGDDSGGGWGHPRYRSSCRMPLPSW